MIQLQSLNNYKCIFFSSGILSSHWIQLLSINNYTHIFYCSGMSATDPFADTDPEDMAVDGIQKKLD